MAANFTSPAQQKVGGAQRAPATIRPSRGASISCELGTPPCPGATCPALQEGGRWEWLPRPVTERSRRPGLAGELFQQPGEAGGGRAPRSPQWLKATVGRTTRVPYRSTLPDGSRGGLQAAQQAGVTLTRREDKRSTTHRDDAAAPRAQADPQRAARLPWCQSTSPLAGQQPPTEPPGPRCPAA